ncbi:type VI secretion system amidase immunity protein Tai4 [Pseudomonas syringae]|uniref:type VI secretion system amidase immunity protein Tai4 n=1 Tax=Pseudomonas syringae TaxID=317 RepID=UPI001CA91FDB|nr:type VI secretion system amidase immunity protein Tai4 [Pseudomonas syringae]MCI3946929.1 type VI secretion system amidase immunity protein Tai4 [Pseudomonas syringae]
MKSFFTSALTCFVLAASTVSAATRASSPEGMHRTHAQNYKDMVLATCIASAYKYSPTVGTDAGSSVTALREWANYDWEISPEKPRELVDNYLARDYTNSLTEPKIKGVTFDLLKCLDLYHSKELNAQTKKAVINPTHTDVQDYRRP